MFGPLKDFVARRFVWGAHKFCAGHALVQRVILAISVPEALRLLQYLATVVTPKSCVLAHI